IFNKDGVEVFSFGKHKGKCVEDVFKIEPSYYAWMMKGDFPIHTKNCLEKIWNRCRQHPAKPANVQKRTNTPKAATLPGSAEPSATKFNQPNQGQRSNNPKPKPISPDMLKSLQEKFGK